MRINWQIHRSRFADAGTHINHNGNEHEKPDDYFKQGRSAKHHSLNTEHFGKYIKHKF
jgi:hypothetical protein